MKAKIMILVCVLGIASLAQAGEKYVLSLLTKSYASGTATNISGVYTNPVGERIVLKSIWMTSVTNLSTIKLSNTSGVTIDIPASLTDDTLYYIPGDGALWLEPSGTITVSGLLAATNTTVYLSIFATRPE